MALKMPPRPVLATPDPVLAAQDPVLAASDSVLAAPDLALAAPDPVPKALSSLRSNSRALENMKILFNS